MKLNETANKRILLSPLNWGMGHVSRCIGLIRQLRAQQNEVLVACDKDQQQILESYFPELEFIFHEGYAFEFEGKGNFATDLFNNRKKLLPRFAREQKQLQQLVKDNRIDLVVSDQRYGFFDRSIPSVFVTHQLQLPLKWYQFVAGWLNTRLIRNFTAVWCMDTPDHALAGDLSKPISKIPIDYIGAFSRFGLEPAHVQTCDKLFVVSGPEPYAEQFFNEVLKYGENRSEQMVCLIPKEYPVTIVLPSNFKLVVSTNWQENDRLFHESKMIVSRAGYSTLMDLEILQKEAVLVPTPGQAEQILLSKLHANHPGWKFCASLH